MEKKNTGKGVCIEIKSCEKRREEENEKIHGCAVGTNGNDGSIIRKSVSRRRNRASCSEFRNRTGGGEITLLPLL